MNRVDKVYKNHDVECSKKRDRYILDQKSLDDLDAVENLTFDEKIGRSIMKLIIKAKNSIGLGFAKI